MPDANPDETTSPRRRGALRIEFGPKLGDHLRNGYDVPSVTVTGGARSAAFRPRRSDIWCVEGHLADGAVVRWSERHGEEVVHVLSGVLSYRGDRCPAGSSIILDTDVPAELVAAGRVHVVHFGAGPNSPTDGPHGPPTAIGRGVHVIGPRGLAEYVEPGRVTRYWADGSAATSRASLFSSARSGPVPQAPHSHSVDEIFMITEGAIVVGRRRIEAGMVVFVAGDQRYAFHGGEHGYTMINYRPDASYFSLPGSDERPVEGVSWPGITWVGDVIVA